MKQVDEVNAPSEPTSPPGERLRVVPSDAPLDLSDASSEPDEPEPEPEPDEPEPEPATALRLYHFPTSFASQQVRLALAEKGAQWDGQIVNTGPANEHFEPWYAELNPKLRVPILSLESSATILSEPEEIFRYLERRFPTPVLLPRADEERSESALWVERAEAFALEELSHGRSKGMVRWFQRWSLRHKRKRLVRLIRKNPTLRELYEHKLRELDLFELAIRDRAATEVLEDEVESLLDDMELQLEERKWLAGAHYSLADLVWTPVLARLEHVGFARALSERRRPQVGRWYGQLRERPSWGAMIRRLSPGQALRFYGPAVVRSVALAWMVKWVITGLVIAIGWLLAHSG